jgi:Sel1 repeat-containing protein
MRRAYVILFCTVLAVSAWDAAAAAERPANGSCWTVEEAKDQVNSVFLVLMAQHIFHDPKLIQGQGPTRFSCPTVPAFSAYPICSDPQAVRAAYDSAAASEHCIPNAAVDAGFSTLRGKAAYDMGENYYYGRGVARDYTAAYGWYLRAGNYVDALTALGYLYENGLGIAQNYEKAFSYYSQAAATGNAEAYRRIGYMYDIGEGRPVNYAQAMSWYQKAAAKSDGAAAYDIAVLYFNGQSVPVNYAEMVRWYSRAASLNDPHGMQGMCDAYGSGQGVQKNMHTALYWCQKALARARQTGDDDVVEWTSKAIDEINNGGNNRSYSVPAAPSNPYAITQDPRFNPSGH